MKVEDYKLSLEAIRRNAKLSQTEAAKKIGVSIMTLSNWETGKTSPKKSDIHKMAEIYNAPIEVFY